MRYPKAQVTGRVSGPLERIPLGKAEKLREGKDALLMAIGSMVEPCLEAAAILEGLGVCAGVMDARFVKPLDVEAIESAASSYPCIITVEEHAVSCGFGSAVLEALSGMGMSPRVRLLGIPDSFVQHGARDTFLGEFGLTPEGIAKATQGEVMSIPRLRRMSRRRHTSAQGG